MLWATYLPRWSDQVVPKRRPSHSSFLISRHHSHTKFAEYFISYWTCRGLTRSVWERTHNVDELLHFTLAFSPNLSHLQRNKCAEFISLQYYRGVIVSSGEEAGIECIQASTLAASASRTCLRISPRFGAGMLRM